MDGAYDAFLVILDAVAATDGNTNVAGVAERLQVHRRTIELVCRQQGTTFREVKQRSQLMRACMELADGRPIKEIALTCGYTQSSFGRFVTGYCGLAPVELQRVLMRGEFKIPPRDPRNVSRESLRITHKDSGFG